MSASAWQSQTKWLSDQTYYSPKAGIWEDRITRRDRASLVTDGEMKRIMGLGKSKLADSLGNLPSRNRYTQAKTLVERLMFKLPQVARDRIAPELKWRVVDLLAAGQGQEALALLRA